MCCNHRAASSLITATAWLRHLGVAGALLLLGSVPALGGVDVSGKAGNSTAGSSPILEDATSTNARGIGLQEGKASAEKIIVRLKSSAPNAAVLAATLEGANLKVGREFRNIPRLKVLVSRQGPGQQAFTKKTLLAKIKALKKSGLFDYVEPDWKVHALQTPTDSAFASGELWGLRNTGQNGGVSGIDINAVPAWSITAGTPSVVVGVIDTGIRYTHQDLEARMWVNPGELAGNGSDDDGNGYVDDVHGINTINGSGDPLDDNDHGSHVAGTIAAAAFNAGQHVGVAYGVRLMALKFLDSSGSGDTSDAIGCIDYAVANGVDILSNSWGGGGYSQALRDAIQVANDAGVLFVAAAGNSAADNDFQPQYPSSYDVPNVVSVAAIDRQGNLAGFSNFGATSVDIAAPGVAILSSTAGSDGSYSTFDGTSMATPHVSGVAALLASQYPGAGVVEIKSRLLISARSLGSLAGRVMTGGMVDAHSALVVAEDGNLEIAATSNGSLEAGQSTAMFISITDIVPVTGATVLASLDSPGLTFFLDNGVTPDISANDGIYTAVLTAPTGVSSTILNVQATAPGKNPAAEAFPFPVLSRPANDDFAERFVLAAGTSQTNGTNRAASAESGEPINPGVAGGKTAWWEWTPSVSGTVTVSTTGSTYDTTLAVYQGTTLGSLILMGANDDASGLQSAVTFSAGVGVTYHFQVDGYAGAEGDIELNYPSPGAGSGGPAIVTQPVGLGVLLGDSFTLSIFAVGQEPLTYQWFLGGVAIPGATGPAYSVAAAAEADEGSYTVEIANAINSIVSNPAYVSVEPIGLVPVNDQFVNVTALPGATGRVNGSNIRASGEIAEPNHAQVSSPLASVWYAWTAPSNGTFTLDTFGSDFDTTLAAYSGPSVGALTMLASNDDTGGLQSAVTLVVTAGSLYRFAVDGYFQAEGQIVLNYAFAPDVGGPANDHFAQRLALIGGSAVGSNIGATGESTEPNHANVSVPLASAWWSWTAPGMGQVTLSTLGSSFDTTVAVYLGASLGSLSEVASNDDFMGLSSQVTIAVSPGTVYVIAVDGFGISEGNVNLSAAFEPGGAFDSDADGVPDDVDNCVYVANGPLIPDRGGNSQLDSDGDDYGNLCDGDLNNNGFTNAQDVILFRQQLGQPSVPPAYNIADLNGNGFVNSQDRVLFRQRIGQPSGPSGLVP